MICRTAACVLTADFVFVSRRFWHLLARDFGICPHFQQILAFAHICPHDCASHTAFSAAASTHTVITATNLKMQWSWWHCRQVWRCFQVYIKDPCLATKLACGMERRLWTARTLVSLHWQPHRTGRRICGCAAPASSTAVIPVWFLH